MRDNVVRLVCLTRLSLSIVYRGTLTVAPGIDVEPLSFDDRGYLRFLEEILQLPASRLSRQTELGICQRASARTDIMHGERTRTAQQFGSYHPGRI